MNTDDERAKIEAAIRGPVEAGQSIVIGWTLVAEFADGEGRRWLTRLSSADLPAWQRDGYLHHGLFSGWQNAQDEDDDESS